MHINNLKIKTFSAVPLSNDTALIGYIDNCDQISSLIKSNRQNTGLREQVELNIINKDYPNFDKFTVPQKYTMFKEICSIYKKPIDLSSSMFLRSRDAEIY